MFKFSRLKKSIPNPHILYNYLNQPVKRLREALGLVDSNELTPGATLTIPSQVKKIEDKSFSIGGQAYDTYSLKAWTVVSGDFAYVLDMGIINVSEGNVSKLEECAKLGLDPNDHRN